MIREVLVDWTTVTGRSGVSVLHFGTEGTLSQLSGTMSNAFAQIAGGLHTGTHAQVRTEVRLIDEVTGLLTGTETFGAPIEVDGVSAASQVVPDVCQGLVSFTTGVVRNGRRVRGRTFIPGMADARTTVTGELSAAMMGFLNAYGTELIGGTNKLKVYSRPSATLAGAATTVNARTAWSEFATQRRRR